MKKTVKRVVSLSLASAMALSLAACNKSGNESTTTTAGTGNGGNNGNGGTNTQISYEKPSSIKVMWDGTILKEGDEDTEALYKAYEAAYDMKIEFIRPDHSAYADYVSQAFASGELPDVLLLSAQQYVQYAARGFLYDMSNDWENSAIRDDNRFSDFQLDIINNMYYVTGKNGEKGLYGLPTTRGNGCVTYVRKSWLEAIGKTADDIKTYDDYYNMLKAMKEKKGLEYVVTGAGYISNEAPYTNYLPEFYQDAYPDFYQKDGKWVDGFQEPEMKEALDRLASAYSNKLLDPQLGTNKTSDARNHFYAGKCGVFTYWAGTWMYTIATNVAAKEPEFAPKDANDTEFGDVVALKPIKEVGKYIERMAPCIAILKDTKNAAGVYKYFVEPIFDGGDVMSVWMYGAKGAQWDNKAETIVINKKDVTYTEGQFHFLLNTSGKQLSKNNIDPLLALCSYQEGKDPAGSAEKACISKIAYDNQQLFNENCTPAPAIKSNSVLSAVAGEIMSARRTLATQVIQGQLSYDAAMEKYNKEYGSKITACLDSLNEQ